MKNDNRDYYPGQWSPEPSEQPTDTEPQKQGRVFTFGFLLSLLCIVTVVSVILTYTLTSAANKRQYSEQLKAQQQTIDRLKESVGEYDADINLDKLELLALLFEQYSYYAGEVSEEELLDTVLRAYAAATGDLYAAYYTEEEYAALNADNVGDQVGIGVSVIQTKINVRGVEYQVFQIIAIYENGPAVSSGLKLGDYIYGVRVGESFRSVNEIGYDQAINHVRGEKGTQAELAVLRPVNDDFEEKYFSITRDEFETVSVTYKQSESDATVGIVQISSFDLTTPKQFKQAVNTLLGKGVKHFVFDVRNNPGGDLQSIKAVLSYFLKQGDLILSAIDQDGNTVTSYYAEPTLLFGDYASCNVTQGEIGMYADLDMVVLCNENTASAAEVFTATLRDYGLAKTVGVTTFGKGIMQSFIPLSKYGNFTGYVKMTTYAYVTKCGVTYHQIGIAPDVAVELSEEAKQYHFYVLPQALDDQLQAAIAQFQ